MVAATPIAWPVAANEDDDVFARRASVVSSGVGLFAPPFRKTMHGGAGAHFLCLRQKTSKPALIRIISIRLQVGTPIDLDVRAIRIFESALNRHLVRAEPDHESFDRF